MPLLPTPEGPSADAAPPPGDRHARGAPRVIELLLAALGLGLAGLDPAGALVAAGALTGGARERHVAAYGLVSLLGTVAFGTALSLVVGPRVAGVDWGELASSPGAALVEAALGLGLVAWGIARVRRPARSEERR